MGKMGLKISDLCALNREEGGGWSKVDVGITSRICHVLKTVYKIYINFCKEDRFFHYFRQAHL